VRVVTRQEFQTLWLRTRAAYVAWSRRLQRDNQTVGELLRSDRWLDAYSRRARHLRSLRILRAPALAVVRVWN